MTRETERSIAIQDGAHKVLSGEMTAAHFFFYFVDHSLFKSVMEFEISVHERVEVMQ